MRNKIIPYKPFLRYYARKLRKNSTLAEILIWKHIKNRAYGVQFHRQVPMLDYIVDFYCHELMLAIEIDGEIHDYSYDYDARRQGRLEKWGVHFLRFSNTQVKTQLFSVLLSIEQTIENLKNEKK